MMKGEFVPAGERVRRSLFQAREVVRRNGISTPRGIEANAGNLIILLSQRRIIEKPQLAGSVRLPYCLDIWQHKRMVFSVNYDERGHVEVAVFEPGRWERELDSLGKASAA
jgi:hypothetical protein